MFPMSDEPPHSRIYVDSKSQQVLDEHLEIVFYEIYNEKVECKESIGQLLDPYAIEIHGDKAVLFGDALDNIEQAIKWASQYGLLSLSPTANYSVEPVPGDEDREINWVAICGETEKVATARLLSHAIVLSGVQWLRNVASSVLNNEGSTAH